MRSQDFTKGRCLLRTAHLKFYWGILDKYNIYGILKLNKLIIYMIIMNIINNSYAEEVKRYMPKEWNELTKLSQGRPLVIERVRLADNGITIEGEFELPPLARLSSDDQVFVMAFIQCHGSIKDMEEMFGISYPTVKNRLNRLAEVLKLVEINHTTPTPSRDDILSRLNRGEISAAEAIERLSK